MDIAKNSILEFKDIDGYTNGTYRILAIINDVDCILLFPLEDRSQTVRPVAMSLSTLKIHQKSKRISKGSYRLPAYLFVSEDDLSEAHRMRRDKNYRLIESLISDLFFLFDYATKKRVNQLAEHALSVKSDRKSVARLLTQYWRNGQDKMALLPAFANSGSAGKERIANEKSLGAPKTTRTLSVKRGEKYKLTANDKDLFRKALKKYYLKERGKTLAKTYQHLLQDSYASEIKIADACSRPPYVPTLKQFNYWAKKLFSKEVVIQARTTEGDYLRNKRAVLGSVSQDSVLPGSVFEIDATVADVHIVSEFSSKYILGRPTIYVVVDRASRMIVGLHVSLFYASWRAARQALSNCFLPKAAYCKQFGIDIAESEWPCAHIPQSLVCDNGEMIGLKPMQVLSPMTELRFTPPYRPDGKGVVEKRFDILNKDVLHDLLGTTRGGQVVRGSRDPRKDSIYTLKEVTIQLIKAVLEHNKSVFDDLALSNALLIENDLAPTPINCWKIHIAKHLHALQPSNTDEVISRLLPPAEVSVTRSGISYNGLYYSCDQIEALNLASIARTTGRWRCDARIDENTTDFIFVRLDKNQEFIKCRLSPRSKMLEGKSMVEAEFVQDWLDAKRELSPVTVESIEDHKQRQSMEKHAKQRIKSSPLSFSKRSSDTRKNRQDEIKATTNMLTTEQSDMERAEYDVLASRDNVRALPRRKRKDAN